MNPEKRKFWWRVRAAAIALYLVVDIVFVVAFLFQPKTEESYLMFFFSIASAIVAGYCFYLHWRFLRRWHLHDFVPAKNGKARIVDGPAPEYWRLESDSGEYILLSWKESGSSSNVQRWRLTDKSGLEVAFDSSNPEHIDLWKKLAVNLIIGHPTIPPTQH